MYDFGGEHESGLSHGAPPRLLTALEFPRWTGEYAASRMLDLVPTRNVGKGRPVLVIPGFSANDQMTGRLRGHLKRRGFRVHGWGLGRNHGLTDRLVEGLPARFDELYSRYEEPISIVGWSFGGLLGRWLAHARPGQVAQVICLGSPWRAEGERTRATEMFEKSRVKHGLSSRAREIVDTARNPLPVPCTAIWSKTDGIVPWQGCVVDEIDKSATNVEVLSSHLGMVANPLVLRVVVDRLARDLTAPVLAESDR